MPYRPTPFEEACAQVAAAATGAPASDFKVEAPPRAELGDFAVGMFAAAKALKKSPAQVATEVAAGFQPTAQLASATATGPFVNFKVDRGAALRWIVGAALRDALVPSAVGANQTICIDFSSPNISKHLAYHHIRSTVIGHSLVQIFRALGYKVVGINHLGDWGTTHGMLLAAYDKWGNPNGDEPLDVSALNKLYVDFREAMKHDPALEGAGRAWFGKLEGGDPDARKRWQEFRDVSWAEFQSVYDLLGITFDEVRGESAYEPDMQRVMDELTSKHLVSESQGALVVELPGEKTPLLLKTKDGTTLYATRDIAAAEYRWNTYQFARSLYVVDRGQGLHFKQLFKTLELAGHTWASKCQHVPFGLVRLGGKKTGTRTGNVVLLKDVFKEATDDVAERMKQSTAPLDGDTLQKTAEGVGIGAVVFANLVSQRDKDVDFDWDKILSLDGDSGPYLQYSHARCASILRKAGVALDASALDDIDLGKLGTDAEWAVARRIHDFAAVVQRAGDACEPHQICHYLLELAGDFSRWYTLGNGDASLRVLCDDEPTRRARLALTAAVQMTLAKGLSLLGMVAPSAM